MNGSGADDPPAAPAPAGHPEPTRPTAQTASPSESSARRRLLLLRRVVDVVNLSTPLGLLVGVLGGGRIERGPHGLLLARGYRARVPAPRAPAVTIGEVVLLRADDATLARRPGLLLHESRHATQYAFWIGPLGFLPAYAAASVWSWLRTSDFALGNPFEVRAGLVDGGYLPPPDAAADAGTV